jgi:hypothetical protein
LRAADWNDDAERDSQGSPTDVSTDATSGAHVEEPPSV